MNDNDNSDIDAAIMKVSKEIVKETKRVVIDKSQSETRLQKQTIENSVSSTLMCL